MTLSFFFRYALFGLACVAIVVLCSAAAQGQPRRVTPLHPDTGVFEVAGRMVSTLGRGEGFGDNIYPIGDCNKDGLSDWLVERNRTDTAFQYNGTKYPKELFLYYGTKGTIPTREAAYRVGPTEIGAYTRYLAHGDWNADGHIDLACRIDLFNDTSYGNKTKLMGRLVLFWGNAQGEYPIMDTTILSTGAAMELALGDGGIWEFNGDGIDDLIVSIRGSGNAVNEYGEIIQVPRFQIFRGRSVEEWRNSPAPRYADFVWWNPPEGELSKKRIDIDCDNYPDLVISGEDQTYGGTFAVLYGSKDGTTIDTSAVEILSLPSLDEKSVKLIDVTKDNVLDLVLLAGRFSAQRIMIWPGEPGERVSEIVFRREGDSLVLREPWANIPTPNALHDGWGDLGYQLYDLGDANLDGYNDIWAFTSPFFVCYSTNQGFDSLIDGIYWMAGWSPISFAPLGDIDGSGIPVVAMGYLNFAGNETGIIYFKPTREIPYTGIFRELPHPPDVQRCFSTVSVAGDAGAENPSSTLGLQVVPNPSSGGVRIRWRGGDGENRRSSETTITIHDVLGREVRRFTVAARAEEAVWNASDTLGGRYFITVTVGKTSETVEVLVQR